MLPVCLGDVFFASWIKVGWNENRSGCQLAAPFSALAVEAGSEAVLVLVWSDLLGLFVEGASVVF